MLSRFRTSQFLRFRAAALALAIIAGSTACDSTTDPDDDEPNVATMRILIGTQTVNVNAANGTVNGGPITIPVGNTTFTVQFLRANGQPDPIVTATTFEVRVAPTNTGVVTFARTGPFAGTLTGVAAGQTSVDFQLFHLIEGHGEFNHPVTVVVQ